MGALLLAGTARGDPAPAQPRLIVLTDISSLTTGVREPDDGQSLVRLMLYANDIDIEGLVASSNMGHGQVVRPELIREAIAAYGEVRPNLLLHDKDYPAADDLLAGVKAGQPVADRETPVEQSVGQGKDTEASEWIIRAADRDDSRPLWIAVWGGSADLAQALWKVRHSRPKEAAEAFVARLRVQAVGDQDSTGPWIRENFPDLFYITRRFSHRGMYRGGGRSLDALVSSDWVETHIRRGHGALGALYPNYDGGDIFSHRLGEVRGIKEGDTPSFFALVPNGLNEPAEPAWGGWGGRHVPDDANPKQFTDAIDDVPGADKDPAPGMAPVYRWRPAYQADFQARLDWCVKPYAEANHAPSPVVNGAPGIEPFRLKAKAGDRVTLDAAGSRDPDKNELSYRWWVYREAGTCDAGATFEDAGRQRTTLGVPGGAASGQTLHVILEVTDDGEPALTSYRRVVLQVE
jgi:hypothetical protein